jgi:putative alpha-1,2-mannosidase
VVESEQIQTNQTVVGPSTEPESIRPQTSVTNTNEHEVQSQHTLPFEDAPLGYTPTHELTVDSIASKLYTPAPMGKAAMGVSVEHLREMNPADAALMGVSTENYHLENLARI